MVPVQSIPVTETGAVISGRPGTVKGAVLTAAGATALVIVTDGNGGAELFRLSAVANTSAPLTGVDIMFRNGVYVTLAGSGARLSLFE